MENAEWEHSHSRLLQVNIFKPKILSFLVPTLYDRYLKIPVWDSANLKILKKFGEKVEMLDLLGNKMRKLPSEIFSLLPNLKWLDLRLEVENY